ncbi:uncharacterized protein LOC114960455 isoform X1 [Acropora millepora]|uniref:uncharacterized protein LOC114960455 isoform X1 n=2 Tax=Acropora millepora TaxID=45264 RepID=UPI001CF5B2ED|nr:uncharacterized protein LOC114960455 isoform X1 [Acropora millepora]
MNGKVKILITAMTAWFFLPNFTLAIERKEYKYVIKKKDFNMKDTKHNSVIVGERKGKDYVLTMKINSTDFKLDLKLVFKNDQRSGNDKVEMDISYEYKGDKVFSYGSCVAKRTRPLTNGTCKPRPPGTLHTAYSLCKTNAVAVLSWWMSGPKSLSNKLDSIYSANIWLAAKGYDGVAFAVDWTRVKVALLAYQVYDGVMVALDWSWVQVKWLVWNACYATMWTAYWICYIVWRIGSGIWIKIVWIGDALAYFYYLHLEIYVTYIKILGASVTRTQVLIFVSTFTNAVFLFMWVNGTPEDRRRRRFRQAPLEREAAGGAAAGLFTNRWKPEKQTKEKIFSPMVLKLESVSTIFLYSTK